MIDELCVSEGFAVGEGDLELGIFGVKIVLEAVKVAGAFPFAHREVVEQVVATGFRARGGDLVLGEYPFHALYG